MMIVMIVIMAMIMKMKQRMEGKLVRQLLVSKGACLSKGNEGDFVSINQVMYSVRALEELFFQFYYL